MSRLTDRLDAVRIVNAHDFAGRGGAPAFITFSRLHPHAQGYHAYRATAYVRIMDGWGSKVFRPSPGLSKVPEIRRDCVEQAQEWLGVRLGAAEWVAGPFPDSWQTKETRARVLALLDELEAS